MSSDTGDTPKPYDALLAHIPSFEQLTPGTRVIYQQITTRRGLDGRYITVHHPAVVRRVHPGTWRSVTIVCDDDPNQLPRSVTRGALRLVTQ